MLDPQDLEPAGVRRLLRSEYEELVNLGAFEDEKIELLRGVLVTMSPQGLGHENVIIWLNRFLTRNLPDQFVVRPGLSFWASDDSVPEPDIMVTLEQPNRLTKPRTAVLLIEVSNSSLRKDQRIKMPLYGEVGVPEYWICDVSRPGKLVVEVYTDPTPTGYATVRKLVDGDVLRPTLVPLEIPVADLPR